MRRLLRSNDEPLKKWAKYTGDRAPYCQIPGESYNDSEENDSGEDDSADEAEFYVEEVLATRFDNGVLEYFVKRQNCPPVENSWEPFDVKDHQYCAKVRDFVFRRRRVRRRTDELHIPTPYDK